jgi:hypothetical protein
MNHVFSVAPRCVRYVLASLRALVVCGLVSLLGSAALAASAPAAATLSQADFLSALAQAWAGDGFVRLTQDCIVTLTNTVLLNSNTTIDAQGHQVTISGNNQVRIFDIQSQTPIAINLIGLTLRGGKSTKGAALNISENATVLLTNCNLSGNHAVGKAGFVGTGGITNTSGDGWGGGNGGAGSTGQGGAIFSLGNLSMFNCSLITNSASGGAGGAGGRGGDGAAWYRGGDGGAGAAGAAGVGGAIYCGAGTVSLKNCTVAGNTATGGDGGKGGAGGGGSSPSRSGTGGAGGSGNGAGVYSRANLTAVNCAFYDNVGRGGSSAAGGSAAGAGPRGADGAASIGGGICSVGPAAVTNCTFEANSVKGGNGGAGGSGFGSYSRGGDGGNGGQASGGGFYGGATVYMMNCTVADCTATGGTNGLSGSGMYAGTAGTWGASLGGGLARGIGRFILYNSVLWSNSSGGNVYGSVIDGGYNISSDASWTVGSTSRINTNPKLQPLAFNGGPTPTMALATNSPALNRITDPTRLPATDQRGVPRPIGKGGDSGAYELALAPCIIAQPVSVVLTNGSSALFTAQAVGASALGYYWQFSGTNVFYGGGTYRTMDTNFLGTNAVSLQVLKASITNVGAYFVVVSNQYGFATSSPALLRIKPYIVANPANTEVDPKQFASFSVTAAADETLQYQWLLNGTNPIPGATGSSFTSSSGARAIDDGLTYAVAVSTSLGSVTSTIATLRVKAPPEIVSDPISQAVALSSNFFFQVTAAGYKPLTYQWRVNGARLVPNPSSPNTGNYTAQTNYDGLWDVVVTNAYGSVTSLAARLTVVTALPTNLSVLPTSLTVTQGQTAVFSASAEGKALSYQWRFKGTPIPGATSTNYSISRVQFTQAGNYDVLVSNPIGTVASAPVTLSVVLPDLALTNPSSVHIPGFQASDVSVLGNYAYLAMAGTGSTGLLQVINIEDPQNPITNGSLVLPASARSVFISGNRAYVACDSAGLQVCDLSNPAEPVLLWALGAQANDVVVSGQYAYVAAGSRGLEVFDVSSSANTTAIAAVTNFNAGKALKIQGNYAYVADVAGSLNVVDVENPAVPRWVTNCAADTLIAGMDLSGSFAYAGTGKGLEVVQISSPDQPGVVGASDSGAVEGVAFANGYVFLAQGTNGLATLDVTTAASPQARGANSALGDARAVDVSGRYVYLAADDGLVIVDGGEALENGPQLLTQPQDVACDPGANVTLSVALKGTAPLGFYWSQDGVALVDGTNSAGSVIRGSASPTLSISGAHFGDSGSYVFVASNSVATATSRTVRVDVRCSYVLGASGINMSAKGFTSSFLVTAAGACDWAASTGDSWIHILSPSGSTNGTGVVSYRVEANLTGSSRLGIIMAGGQQFQVSQGPGYVLSVETSGAKTEASMIATVDNNGDGGGQTPFERYFSEGFVVTLSAPLAVGQSIFQGWQIDGATVANDPVLSVTMDADHTATALYAPSFVSGTYRGLFYDTNGVALDNAGAFKIISSAKGGFSGFLQMGAKRYPVSGRFDSMRTAMVTNSVAGRDPSVVVVELKIDQFDKDRIAGSVALTSTNGDQTALLVGDRAFFDGHKNIAQLQKGRYTLAIPGDCDSTDTPGGDSIGTVKISGAGVISLAGSTADGAKITQSAVLSKDGFWPLYVPLYRGRGALLSWILVSNTEAGDLNGSIIWMKSQVPKEKFYGAGFSVETDILGSRYAAPARHARLLNLTNACIVLSGGGLEMPLTNHVVVRANNTVSSTNRSALVFNLTSGAFSGHVPDAANKPIYFKGVILTNALEGTGYFLGTNASGRVTIKAE